LCSGVYVAFRGTDNHPLRTGVPDIVSTATCNGSGVQFEAILTHSLNKSFSIGAAATGRCGDRLLHQHFRHALSLPNSAVPDRTLWRIPAGFLQARRMEGFLNPIDALCRRRRESKFQRHCAQTFEAN
jgi:hypothetical protein